MRRWYTWATPSDGSRDPSIVGEEVPSRPLLDPMPPTRATSGAVTREMRRMRLTTSPATLRFSSSSVEPLPRDPPVVPVGPQIYLIPFTWTIEDFAWYQDLSTTLCEGIADPTSWHDAFMRKEGSDTVQYLVPWFRQGKEFRDTYDHIAELAPISLAPGLKDVLNCDQPPSSTFFTTLPLPTGGHERLYLPRPYLFLLLY